MPLLLMDFYRMELLGGWVGVAVKRAFFAPGAGEVTIVGSSRTAPWLVASKF